MGSVLAETLGRQLLHSDIWFLADKCANLVKRIHEPLERSVAVLDNILTLEDEEANRTSSNVVDNSIQDHLQHRSRPNERRNLEMNGGNYPRADDYFNRQYNGKQRMNNSFIIDKEPLVSFLLVNEKPLIRKSQRVNCYNCYNRAAD